MKNLIIGILLFLFTFISHADVKALQEDFLTFKSSHSGAIEKVFAQTKLYECAYEKKLSELKNETAIVSCDSELEYVRLFQIRRGTEKAVYSNIAIGIRDAHSKFISEIEEVEIINDEPTKNTFDQIFNFADKTLFNN